MEGLCELQYKSITKHCSLVTDQSKAYEELGGDEFKR